MIKKFSKLFLVLSMILFVFVACGCSFTNEDEILVINSHESSKILPSTIFEIEIKRKYNVEEDYKFVVRYGHKYRIDDEEYEKFKEHYERTLGLFLAHHFESGEGTSIGFNEIISGIRILEIEKFLSPKYNVNYELNNGKEENITFNNEETVAIPKEVILNKSGVISLSFINFSLNEDNENRPTNFEGSVIYLKYLIKGDKIYFKKGK